MELRRARAVGEQIQDGPQAALDRGEALAGVAADQFVDDRRVRADRP